MTEDPRQAAARYRLRRLAREQAIEAGEDPDAAEAALDDTPAYTGSTPEQRAAYIETSIQQAIRRGEFDDLPGSGKPLEGLGRSHDPDWWIRRKIESENLRGLGPPALTLRVEDAEMSQRLDALTRAEDVREAVQDFNARVIDARRQLLGGPPVVTPTRDVEAEVSAWQDRRAERERADTAAQAPSEPSPKRGLFRRTHRSGA